MTIAGEIAYKVTVDTTGLKKGLQESEKETKGWASTIGTIAKDGAKVLGASIVAGVATATTAIAGLVASATKGYAEYEQLVGGIETMFGTGGRSLEEYAQKQGKTVEEVAGEYRKLVDTQDIMFSRANAAFMTAGLSANQYMETVTGFSASLIQSLGGDTAKATQYADQAIIDMADNANKMGTSMESIQNAYQGFAKQNYTMLDNLKLGYGGTKQEMERLLEDAGKIAGVKFNIDSFADVTQAIHIMQENMDIAGTTAREAQETISGSLGMMKASWDNLIVGVGDDTQDFDDLMTNFIESAKTFGKNIIPTIKVAIKGAVQLIAQLAPEIIAMLPPLIQELLPAILEGAQTLIQALVDALPLLLDVILQNVDMFISTVLQIANAIIQALPQIIAILTLIVGALVKALLKPENIKLIIKAGLDLLVGLVQAIPEVIVALVDALPDIIEGIIEFLTDPQNLVMLIDATVKLFTALVLAVPKILGALIGAFGKLFIDLWAKIQQGFTDFFGNFGETVKGVFKGAVNGVLQFIENFINGPIDILNSFIDGINSAFGAVGVNLGKISRVKLPRLASGGIVPATAGGQIILAGEAGEDEWVVPESKMASMIEQLGQRGATTGNNITIEVSGIWATSAQQKREVALDIYRELQGINATRMNAFGGI